MVTVVQTHNSEYCYWLRFHLVRWKLYGNGWEYLAMSINLKMYIHPDQCWDLNVNVVRWAAESFGVYSRSCVEIQIYSLRMHSSTTIVHWPSWQILAETSLQKNLRCFLNYTS